MYTTFVCRHPTSTGYFHVMCSFNLVLSNQHSECFVVYWALATEDAVVPQRGGFEVSET